MAILVAEKIHKYFNSLEVLKGVDFKTEKGEISAIIGASGAGKSTLLHILGTLDKHDSGSLTINNRNISNLRGNELSDFRNKEIGFVFQFHNLLPEFSAKENICIPAYLAKNSSKQIEARSLELMELLGIAHRADHKPSELSGGEQQRVAVARALINSPSIIFADEPSGNLDSKNAEELHSLFIRLRNELNQTFIIVTHNNDLANIADKRYEMKDGKLISFHQEANLL